MPSSWDPKVYRERAEQWREAAAGLPPGKERDACLALSEGYERLAELIAASRRGEKDRERS